MGDRMGAFDWSATSLGPIVAWPQCLKTASSLLLRSPVPMVMLWGEDGVMIYNDGYAVIAGQRHPHLLGARVREGWPEVADFNDNVMRIGLAGGTLAYKDQELTLYRRGVAEQVWMNLDYSPVLDEDGEPAGVIAIVVETTAQVLAQRREALERSRLTQLFEQAPSFICTVQGPDHVFEFVNAAHRRMFGSDDWIGRSMADAFPDIAGQGFEAIMDRVLQTGESYVANAVAARFGSSRDAEPDDRVLDVVYEPLRDETGAVTGIFIEGHDVTDWLHAEAEAKRSRARYEALFDAIDDGFCIIEVIFDETDHATDYRFLEVNPAFALQTGLADAAGKTMRELAPDHEAHWFELYGRVALTGEPVRFEGSAAALNRHYDVYAVRIGDPVDRQVAILFKDISERQAAEAALREMNDQLEVRVAAALAERRILADIVEDAEAFVQVVDNDLCILAVNRASADEFERLFDVRPRVGESLIALFANHPARQANMRTVWARALGGERFTETVVFEEAGGRAYEMRFSPLLDADGAQIGAYQFVYDITARLEEQARLRTAEEALRQSQKMEAIGQLTGGVAHDFNNLLTPIVGALDMIGRRLGDDPRMLRLTDGALQAAERARILVQRLLAFSRRQHLQARAVDVAELIDGMADLLTRSLGPRIALKVETDSGLPAVRVDPNQLELALLNLAVNARDAMADGGELIIRAWLETSSARLAEAGLTPDGFVAISVVDTGAGMERDVLNRAVEPFFTTKGVGQGTGLGLSSVQGLAVQSGGAFRLQSTPGAGTAATVWLPVADQPLRAVSDVNPTVTGRPAGVAAVLLVDDEDLVREAAAEMLVDAGHSVIQARSGNEALDHLRQGLDVDIIITDYAMPGMTGADLAREARWIAPRARILLLTGYAALNDAEAGGLPRLAKPFRQSDLAAAVAELVDEPV